jgi:hypothetical protein
MVGRSQMRGLIDERFDLQGVPRWFRRFGAPVLGIWASIVGVAHAATASDASVERIQSLTRTELLQLACERIGTREILTSQQQMLELLTQGRPSDSGVRYTLALQLYTNGRLNYREAAVVLAEIDRAQTQYDRSFVMGGEALTAFVALFPLAVSDGEIKEIAAQAHWIPTVEEWAAAFWIADVSRMLGRSQRMTLQWLGPIVPEPR